MKAGAKIGLTAGHYKNTDMTLIRSPLAYQGSKFKLLHELVPLFSEFDTLHDIFGGSATVSLNAPCKRVLYNEGDARVVDIFRTFVEIGHVEKIIAKYNRIVRTRQLSRTNQAAYEKTVAAYNKNPNPFLLWVISKHSFCSLMRFNQKGGFNYPFGKRSLVLEKGDPWLSMVLERLGRVKLHNMPYLQYVKKYHKRPGKNAVFYFDPPYLASGDNVYYKKWSEEDERKLLDCLDYLDSLGIRWILSNVVRHRNLTNTILRKWCKQYNCLYPVFNTSGEGYTLNRVAETGKNKTVEIIVKNF